MPGKTTLSDHAVLYLPVSTFVGTGFLFTLCKEKLMKRHLNTSYRLVWNHITGTLVVASELARSRGKRAGVAIALSLAAVTSVPALAADTVVQAGETVNDGTLTNHDNQIVLGTANGMTISTGLEYGPDNEANTGGQWIQNGGIANNTTVTGGGLQRVNAGGSVSDTVISAGGGQSLQGQAVNTTLNGGEQWVHEGGIATGTVINEKGWQAIKSGAVATDTVVNTGAEGGPDAEMVIPGRPSTEMPYAPPSIKMVVRLWLLKERQIPLWFMPAATRLYMVTHWIPR